MLREAGVSKVEWEERESSRFKFFSFLSLLVSGGIIGFARAQMASVWSSGREWSQKA